MRLPEAAHLFIGECAVLKGRQEHVHLGIEDFAKTLPTIFGLVFSQHLRRRQVRLDVGHQQVAHVVRHFAPGQKLVHKTRNIARLFGHDDGRDGVLCGHC